MAITRISIMELRLPPYSHGCIKANCQDADSNKL